MAPLLLVPKNEIDESSKLYSDRASENTSYFPSLHGMFALSWFPCVLLGPAGRVLGQPADLPFSPGTVRTRGAALEGSARRTILLSLKKETSLCNYGFPHLTKFIIFHINQEKRVHDRESLYAWTTPP